MSGKAKYHKKKTTLLSSEQNLFIYNMNTEEWGKSQTLWIITERVRGREG